MRRSVFFAVCLGLVLSLLKEAPAEAPTNTTVTPSSAPTENGTDKETVPDPPGEKPSEPREAPAEAPTNTTVTPSSAPTEDDTENETDPDPAEEKPSEGAENGTDKETDPDPPGEKPSEPREAPAETPTNTTVTPTSAPTANTTANATSTESPDLTTSEPSDNSTVNGTGPDTTDMPTSAPPGDFCYGYPCGTSSATCISLESNYSCVCQYGYYYRNKNCYKGKVYPATIAVKASYSDNLKLVNSTEYQELFNNLTAFFKEAFKNISDYTETVIRKIEPLSESRSSAERLNVTVTNLFMEDFSETPDSVRALIAMAISNDSFVSSYEVARHCAIYECDLKTTVCEEKEFPECKCKPDLEKTIWDDRSCSICSDSCSAANHKYCIREEEGLTCKCMTNFKRVDGECVACSVGYSGEECSDNSELILIIVGTVLGAVILCLVIAVSVVSVRAKHKQNPEKRSLIKSGYSDMNTSEDRPSMFPRVQTTSGHANPGYQHNNPYEMRSTNRDRFPERDYDDLYEISREPTGFRTQSRY